MRIAIVDDDPVNLQLVTSLVRETGDGEPVPVDQPRPDLDRIETGGFGP